MKAFKKQIGRFFLMLFIGLMFEPIIGANIGWAGPDEQTPLAESLQVYDPDKLFIAMIKEDSSLVIDHVNQQGYEVFGPVGTFERLQALGAMVTMDTHRKEFDNYPSFEEVEQKLKNLAAKYPDITELFSIGKSVRKRDLWVLKISDNPRVDEIEPEFKYISSMHGDEITGRELCLIFIEDILKMYQQGNARIVKLVENTEIFIMPSMNPDGSERRVRWNANGRDLNRNFPDFTTRDNQNTTSGREPETIAVMNWQKSRKFALSANFHGGTIVANYPWDTTKSRFPLLRLVENLSKEYSQNNPDMISSTEFPGGITNGYDWYEVDGGMQDWSYHWHDDLQITIELSHRKWPSYSSIEKHYGNNKESMIRYIERVHQGAGITFNDRSLSGKVKITQTLPIEKDFGAFDFSGGEFYKVLPAGEYVFEFNGREYKRVVSDF